jgi:hypothetical protein
VVFIFLLTYSSRGIIRHLVDKIELRGYIRELHAARLERFGDECGYRRFALHALLYPNGAPPSWNCSGLIALMYSPFIQSSLFTIEYGRRFRYAFDAEGLVRKLAEREYISFSPFGLHPSSAI